MSAPISGPGSIRLVSLSGRMSGLSYGVGLDCDACQRLIHEDYRDDEDDEVEMDDDAPVLASVVEIARRHVRDHHPEMAEALLHSPLGALPLLRPEGEPT